MVICRRLTLIIKPMTLQSHRSFGSLDCLGIWLWTSIWSCASVSKPSFSSASLGQLIARDNNNLIYFAHDVALFPWFEPISSPRATLVTASIIIDIACACNEVILRYSEYCKLHHFCDTECLRSPNLNRFVTYYVCDIKLYHLYVQVLVHGHSWTCEFAMSNFCDLRTIAKIANITMAWTVGGLQYPRT